jgi:hypothetical protein
MLERADLQIFVDHKNVLKDLDKMLFRQYVTTNNYILDGSNMLAGG